ncbi:MAG: VOC family protein, partial [Gemmatimonadales bacterium]
MSSNETESFRASALSVALTVKDLAASLAWYQDVVGFAAAERHDRDGKLAAVAMRAGDAGFMINQDDGQKGWDRVKGQGFAMMFTTSDDLDALAAGIKQRGGTLEMEPTDMPWGAKIFVLIDPDGYKLVVSSPRG